MTLYLPLYWYSSHWPIYWFWVPTLFGSTIITPHRFRKERCLLLENSCSIPIQLSKKWCMLMDSGNHILSTGKNTVETINGVKTNIMSLLTNDLLMPLKTREGWPFTVNVLVSSQSTLNPAPTYAWQFYKQQIYWNYFLFISIETI